MRATTSPAQRRKKQENIPATSRAVKSADCRLLWEVHQKGSGKKKGEKKWNTQQRKKK
jgi:hypothetical protein